MSLLTENTFLVFFIINVIGGGGAAFLAGRSTAIAWQPVWQLVVYMLIFGAGLRFLHFALFQETLTSGYYYIVQTAIVTAFALLGYRMTRVNQMTQKYPWLYQKTSPFGWQDKT